MTDLTENDYLELRQRLLKRREELQHDIDHSLREAKSDDTPAALAPVRDPADESVAEIAASTNFTILDRETAELRNVEDALERMRLGTYGTCIECGRNINRERLMLNPAIERCFDDQRRLELRRAGGQDLSPSL